MGGSWEDWVIVSGLYLVLDALEWSMLMMAVWVGVELDYIDGGGVT